jgi:hypothetical protein
MSHVHCVLSGLKEVGRAKLQSGLAPLVIEKSVGPGIPPVKRPSDSAPDAA